MNNTFQVPGKTVDYTNEKNNIPNRKKIYKKYRFTNKQKVAIERLLLQPSKENAINAFKATPKAYLFLKEIYSEEEIIEIIIVDIEDKKDKLSKLASFYKAQIELFIKSREGKKSKKTIDRNLLKNQNLKL